MYYVRASPPEIFDKRKKQVLSPHQGSKTNPGISSLFINANVLCRDRVEIGRIFQCRRYPQTRESIYISKEIGPLWACFNAYLFSIWSSSVGNVSLRSENSTTALISILKIPKGILRLFLGQNFFDYFYRSHTTNVCQKSRDSWQWRFSPFFIPIS